MVKKILAPVLILVCSLAYAGPNLAGVDVADSVSFDNVSYGLSGAGIRKKVVLKLYVGSLYTDRAIKGGEEVLKGPASSVIRLDIISGIITSKLMAETVQEGFEKAMGGDTRPLQGQIDSFIAVFNEEIVKGDSFTFVSVPGKGVTAYKGNRLLKVIEDDRFRETLFTIWLGDEPADKDLKKAMLGK